MDLLLSNHSKTVVARVTDVTAKKQKSLGNARTCAHAREGHKRTHERKHDPKWQHKKQDANKKMKDGRKFPFLEQAAL